MKSTKKAAYAAAFLCAAAALVLESFPLGAVLNFRPSPEEAFVAYRYSYFDLTPFGYANFTPLLTGLLTAAVVLALIVLLRKTAGRSRVRSAAYVCSILSAALSFMPLLLFGASYMTGVSYLISALLFISVGLQAVSNRT